MKKKSRCYYNKGHLPVAFVFSAPGAREKESGKPVAGNTGENINIRKFLRQKLLVCVVFSGLNFGRKIC